MFKLELILTLWYLSSSLSRSLKSGLKQDVSRSKCDITIYVYISVWRQSHTEIVFLRHVSTKIMSIFKKGKAIYFENIDVDGRIAVVPLMDAAEGVQHMIGRGPFRNRAIMQLCLWADRSEIIWICIGGSRIFGKRLASPYSYNTPFL